MYCNMINIDSCIVAIKLNNNYFAKFEVITGFYPKRLGYDLLGLLREIEPDDLKENCQKMTFNPTDKVHKLDEILDIFKTIVRHPGAIPFEQHDQPIGRLDQHSGYFYIIDLDRDRFDTIFAHYDRLSVDMVERLKARNIYVEPVIICDDPHYQYYGRISSVNLFIHPPKTHYLNECESFINHMQQLDRFLEPYRLIDEDADGFTNLSRQMAMEEAQFA